MQDRLLPLLGIVFLSVGILAILAEGPLKSISWALRLRRWFEERGWRAGDWGATSGILAVLINSAVFPPQATIGVNPISTATWGILVLATLTLVLFPLIRQPEPKSRKIVWWAAMVFLTVHLILSW